MLDGLHRMCIGDMRMRSMHSMGYAISQFDVEARFMDPPEISLADDFQKELGDLNVRFREVASSTDAIADADSICMSRWSKPTTPSRARR